MGKHVTAAHLAVGARNSAIASSFQAPEPKRSGTFRFYSLPTMVSAGKDRSTGKPPLGRTRGRNNAPRTTPTLNES